MSDVKELLEAEIKRNFEGLNDLEAGSEQYAKTIIATGNMIDKYCELVAKESDNKTSKLDKCIKIADITCKVVLGVIGLRLSYNAYLTSMAFEVDNTFTTTAGKETSRYLLGLSRPKIF